MPTNPGVSEVQDKNGVVADIEAKRFDGTRTVQIQGDVTASQTWNGDSSYPLTLNASIGAKKVTQDKIGDEAVGSEQMKPGSVGLTQMAASAMTDSVSANNSKLVTSQGVNAAIAAATLNRGKDYGPLSVDEINAISETIPTGSTVYVESLGAGDAKVINDGYSDGTMSSFSVEVGEDLKYYRSPDNSLHGWYSTEANVKIKQPANYAGGIAVDSAQDASSGSAGIEFIQSLKQDTNGNIRDIVKAQVDIVDSTSSTRTNAAATPNSVKSAYDLANTANTGLANKLDKTGDGKDVTVSFSEASARANIGTGEKLSVMFGKIKKWFTDLKALAFKDTAGTNDIADDAITAAKVKDNETLPVSISGNAATATTATSATTATKLGSSNVGSSSSPIHLVAGVPIECSYSFVNTTQLKAIKGAPSEASFVEIGKMSTPSGGTHDVITIVGTVGSWQTESHQINVSVSNRGGIKFYGMRQGSTSVDFEIQVYKNADDSSDVVLRLGTFCRYNLVVFSDSSDISIAGTTGVTTGTLQSETMKNSANVIFLGNGSVVQNSTYATKLGSNSSHPQIGDASIPVYVDSDGQVKACIPSSMSVGTATTATDYASGGGIANALAGKQDSLTFMNDSEAVAIWNDAKTAAANAS